MLQATWAAVFRASAAGVEARCINVELLIIISCVRRVLERRWKSARKDSVCSLVKMKRFAASYSDFLFHFSLHFQVLQLKSKWELASKPLGWAIFPFPENFYYSRSAQSACPGGAIGCVAVHYALPGYGDRGVWVRGPGWPDHCVRL